MGGKLKMFVDSTCRYKYDGSPDWNLNCNAYCFTRMFLDNVNDFITNQRKRTIDVSWSIIIMWCYLCDVLFDISTDKF